MRFRRRPPEQSPVVKTTVLDGYYASGDHECFCFDRWDGPDAYYAAFPDSMDERRWRMMDENRVYPDHLLPDELRFNHPFGRWTITVEFEPLQEPRQAATPKSAAGSREGQ
jgi:hypothetical protein